jgi:chromosome partitioning protein
LLDERIANNFDIILLDVPPRMTTATINALCASTHVLIPSIFNRLSAEPVGNFVTMAKALMDKLNPKLEFLGVVETLRPTGNVKEDIREKSKLSLTQTLQKFTPRIPILETYIPRKPALADGVAYLSGTNGRECKAIFNNLGDEISRRIGFEN